MLKNNIEVDVKVKCIEEKPRRRNLPRMLEPLRHM